MACFKLCVFNTTQATFMVDEGVGFVLWFGRVIKNSSISGEHIFTVNRETTKDQLAEGALSQVSLLLQYSLC